MSLTFVFAPVEVREEMAAALPVSLQPPLSYKIPNKWTLKGFLWFLRLPRHSGQQAGASGAVSLWRGLWKGCEPRGRGWRWTPMADQVVPWPRLQGLPQKAISRVNDC